MVGQLHVLLLLMNFRQKKNHNAFTCEERRHKRCSSLSFLFVWFFPDEQPQFVRRSLSFPSFFFYFLPPPLPPPPPCRADHHSLVSTDIKVRKSHCKKKENKTEPTLTPNSCLHFKISRGTGRRKKSNPVVFAEKELEKNKQRFAGSRPLQVCKASSVMFPGVLTSKKRKVTLQILLAGCQTQCQRSCEETRAAAAAAAVELQRFAVHVHYFRSWERVW